MSPLFDDNQLILFQGDSITDAGRSRDDLKDMGHGYAAIASAWFSATYPEKRVHFLNRGVSGNRVVDLRSRWEEDTIALKPDWVSVLIGINDTWRRYDSNSITTTEAYHASYLDILQRAKAAGARLIICEPFMLPTPPDRIRWREDLDPKIGAVRQLARQFDAIYVPLDGVFAAASARRESDFWLPDGVHPTPAGHALIAQAWLMSVGAL